MIEQTQSIPIVDYGMHPAFAHYDTPTSAGNDEIDIRIAEIDSSYAEVASRNIDVESRRLEFDRIIAPKLDALERLALSDDQIKTDYAQFLRIAIGIARSAMRDDLGARHFSSLSNSDAQNLKSNLSDALRMMHGDGFCQFNDARLARRVWKSTFFERIYLRMRARKWPHRHCVVALHPRSPGALAIEQMMREAGLQDLIAAYLGKPVEFYYAALDYAHPAQNWYKNCYSDIGLATSSTAYMHFDADCDIVKAMFYLQDVRENDGPFRYVRGSHRWHRSPLACAVQKGFDQGSWQFFSRSDDKIDFLLGHYRPRFKERDHRAGMMSLPRQFRGSTHFGDDLLENSELSQKLLQLERSFISPAGTMVVFDGSRGIHRGSQVEAGGKRWAIQLAFRVCQNDTNTHTSRFSRLKNAFRGKASWLKYLAHGFATLRSSG